MGPRDDESAGPPVRPLTEGYIVKGGHNLGTSQIRKRPSAPAPMPSTAAPSKTTGTDSAATPSSGKVQGAPGSESNR
jgi:hypothetical protein